MKKVLFSLLGLAISLQFSFAAGGGPDIYGYTWKDSNEPTGPVYNWIPIETFTEAVEVKLLGDDNNRGPFPMGINFQYYWYQPSLFWVGSNGYIGFNNGQIASPFPNIPATAAPNDFCAVMASDLTFDGDSNIAKCYFWRSNDNDTLIVSWLNVPFWQVTAPTWTGANTFQIIFSTVDSSITYQYNLQTGTTNAAASPYMTIGIENVSGSIGLQSFQNTYPPANYAIKYYYPANTTYQVSDAATMWNNNSDNGGIILINSSPYTMSAQVQNVGNQNLPAFNVLSRVLNAAGSNMVNGTQATTALTPGQSQTVTYTSNLFTPIIAGTYRQITDTQLPGDATPSNNSKTLEMLVVDTSLAQIKFSFDDNAPDATGLSWQGGGGGAAVYYKPPFYPCRIDMISIYIMSNPNMVPFRARIYDDDGSNGSASTILSDTLIAASSVISGGWNDILLDTPVVINSGGFYAAWIMEGDGIVLGVDQNPPLSFRTFEVLGSTWAIYRNGTVEDLMINVYTTVLPDTTSSLSEKNNSLNAIQLYPNPASEILEINTNGLEEQINAVFMDASGKVLASRTLNAHLGQNFSFDIDNLDYGMYFVKFTGKNSTITKKFIKK